MTHDVSIDIETFSNVDIKKAGLYRYAQSPAFDILLIAWAVDNGPVRIVDMTTKEQGGLEDFLTELSAEGNILHAYNAAFEHYCINTWLRRQGRPEIPLSRWRCTMAHGLYCGYTAGLGATGEAMGSVGLHVIDGGASGVHYGLGYFIRRGRWNRGYATEAVSAALGFIFAADACRVTASCLAENLSSRRVLEKCGFSQEGLMKQHTWHDGEWKDCAVYGLLKDRPS